MVLFSDLSYIETSKTVVWTILTKVIILAPLDFPLPLEEIAKRILKKLLPRNFPCPGCSLRLFKRIAKSFLNDGYFFDSRFACLSKS